LRPKSVATTDPINRRAVRAREDRVDELREKLELTEQRTGRVFAPSLEVPSDLAGAAGAASGISGGYHLPVTAVALVLGQGGPALAMLTCVATVVVAAFAGTGVAFLLDRLLTRWPHPVESDSYTF